MRTGLILSALTHLTLWAVLAFAIPQQLPHAAPQAIEVAIVSAKDAPPPPSLPAEEPQPVPAQETKPDSSVLAAQPPQPPPPPPSQPSKNSQSSQSLPPTARPSTPPQPPAPPDRQASLPPTPAEEAIPDPATLADMLMLPAPSGSNNGFDRQAEHSAKLTATDIVAFKTRLKSCAKLPDAVASDKKLKIVLRVAFKPDATLAGEPTLVAGTPSINGPALVAGALAALKSCQPFVELPAAKYKEWKVLDVTLRPQDLLGG